MDSVTQQTLQLIQTALQNPMQPDTNALRKIFAQATGLVQYDLQPAAKILYPVLTPLRNRIRRVAANGGTATHWKAITGINIANLSPGVAEGQRGGTIATTLVDRLASFKTLSFEDAVTLQADWAARGFDDPKARAVEGLLRSLMIGEEKIILAGNASLPLQTTPTPNVTASNAGGSLSSTGGAAGVYSVICVALTPEGYYNSSISGGIPGQITRASAIGETITYGGGNAQKSTAGSGTVTTGSNGSLACTVAPVVGAAAYAWFCGAAGSETLVQITTINSCLIEDISMGVKALGTLADGDYSTNALIYDGLITQALLPNSGAYYAALATGTAGTGTPLTTNGQGGVAEFDTAFAYFWDNFKLSPEEVYVSRQELVSINKIVVENGGAPLIRFNLDAARTDSSIDAGVVVGTLLNPVTNTKVQVITHPNAVPGTVKFHSNHVPYKLSNVGDLQVIECRSDYYQLEWPRRTNQYEYGVYMDGVLLDYFPPAGGVITNIAPA